MRKWLVMSSMSVVLVLSAAPAPRAADDLPEALAVMEKSGRVFEDLSKRVRPAVVNIRPYTRDEAWWAAARPHAGAAPGWRAAPQSDLQFQGYRPGRGASGFLVSADGFIVTLRRLVVDSGTGREADLVGVEIGQEYFKATIVGLEPTLDLAILKVEPREPFPFLRFGDSSKAQPGHWAIAFGDPDGVEQSLVPGFVAFQPSRECYQDDLGATYLQTSVIVSDGALGGPLVNLKGEVIGVNARRRAKSPPDTLAAAPGSGYALPSNIASAVYQGMLMRDSRESPWIGISVLKLDDALRRKLGNANLTGIYIDNVFDPSPATAAGIRVGDVLQSMDGEAIRDVHDFQRLLYHSGAGSRVRMGMVRGGKKLEVSLTIARRPPEATTH